MRKISDDQVEKWARMIFKDYSVVMRNREGWFGEATRMALISDLVVDLFSGLDEDTLKEVACDVIVKVRLRAFSLAALISSDGG